MYKKFYLWAICAYLGVGIWLFLSFTTEGQMNIVVCPVQLLFHIPCPGCGVTRATMLFLRGHIREALSLNLNVIFSIGYIFIVPILLVYDFVMKKFILYNAYRAIDSILKYKWAFFSFIVLELYVWIHNIIHHI